MPELVRREAPPVSWGVSIDDEAIARFVEGFEPLEAGAFDYSGLPRGLSDGQWYDFIVLAVSCVACLWPPEGEQMWSTEFEGEALDDAPGFFAAFTKELARADLAFQRLRHWETSDVERLFAGDGVLQLLPERLDRIRRVAACAVDRWDGSFANLVREAGFSAPGIARLLVETVPGYRDEAETELGTLRFWKLAHLATSMISEQGPAITGLETLPVYPDYMVPRTLRHHGVLVYADDLAAAIDSRTVIDAGSPWELAIRWASMHAAERILSALEASGRTIEMPTLDYWLWHSSVLGPDADRMGEHHRTLTMHY